MDCPLALALISYKKTTHQPMKHKNKLLKQKKKKATLIKNVRLKRERLIEDLFYVGGMGERNFRGKVVKSERVKKLRHVMIIVLLADPAPLKLAQ